MPLNRLLISLSGFIIIGMTLLIFVGITLRYCFDVVIVGVDEIVSMLIPLLVMLSISSLISNHQHINIDLLIRKLSIQQQQLTARFHQCCHLLVGLILLVSGVGMVFFSWRYTLLSPSELGVPDWIVQLSIPLGGLLMVVGSLKNLRSSKQNTQRGQL